MTIELKNIGKKFNKDWLFKNLNYTFNENNFYAITGLNGSGKSTLLQIIAGFILPTEGKIINSNCLIANENKQVISEDEAFKQMVIAAPYLELIEEMTAIEFLQFHSQFKPYINNITINEILEIIQLSNSSNKQGILVVV